MCIDHAVFGAPFGNRFSPGGIFDRLDNMIGIEDIVNKDKINETAFDLLFVRNRGDAVCQQLPADDPVQRVELAVGGTFERKSSVLVGERLQCVTEQPGSAGVRSAFGMNENIVLVNDLHDDMGNSAFFSNHASQIGKSQTVRRNMKAAQMHGAVIAA